MAKTKQEIQTENDLLKKQLQDMQSQMTSIMGMIENKNQGSNINDRFNLVSNMLGENGIVIKNKDYMFNDYDDSVNLGITEVSEFINNEKLRKLLIAGVFHFKEKEVYDKFGLTADRKLDTEYYVNLLKKSEKEVIDEISYITENKGWDALVHIMSYRIADLIKRKKVNIDVGMIKALDEFFKFNEFDYNFTDLIDYSLLKTHEAEPVYEEKNK